MLAPVLVAWNFGEYVFFSSNLLQTGARKKITGRKNAFLVRLNRVYLLTQFVKCRQNFPGLLDCSQVWKEKGNWIRRRVFSFTPIKRQIRSFHRRSDGAVDVKEMCQEVGCKFKVVGLPVKLNWTAPSPSPRFPTKLSIL